VTKVNHGAVRGVWRERAVRGVVDSVSHAHGYCVGANAVYPHGEGALKNGGTRDDRATYDHLNGGGLPRDNGHLYVCRPADDSAICGGFVTHAQLDQVSDAQVCNWNIFHPGLGAAACGHGKAGGNG
jgi:hypothetical protein